jgi:ankyrin repeat protein
LAHGGDGTFLGVSNDTLVHVALNNYDKKMLKILLDTSSDHPANVDLGALDGNGYTAANLAVGLGNAEILALIIADERADLTKANKEGNIPLHTAIRLQRSDMVTMLLVRDSPQFTTDDQGYTPMHIAVDVGDMQIMKILWEFNTAKIMPPDDCQTVESPLFTAVRKNRLPEYKLLRTMTKNYAAVNAFGESCLYLVVSRGMDDFLEVIVFGFEP